MLDDQDKQWILEQLERVETRLLTELQQTSPRQLRARTRAAVLHAWDLEVEALTKREDKRVS